MSNVKDNLMTKDNLTYEQCYQRLMDLTTEDTEVGGAYSTTTTKPKGRNTLDGNAASKECTWCAKHHPKSSNKGHTWNECNKLKAHQEKKKNEKGTKEEKKEEVARATGETQDETVSTPDETTTSLHPFTPDTAANCYHSSFPPSRYTPSNQWIFDTGASSHMTNNLDLFLDISHCRRRIRYANKTESMAVGIGRVAVQGKLPNSKTSSVILRNVLYVPDLGSGNLFSWPAICNLGFVKVGMSSDIFIRKELNGDDLLWARMDCHEFVIQQESEHARLSTFAEWHSALGHVSPASIHPDCYTDGYLLPIAPTNFECHQCALSKSTKKVPPPAPSHAKKPLDMFHSDLSGKFSIQSFGKSQYYITFIDDKTRYTWVRFLHTKDDAITAIQAFIKERETQDSARVLRFRTDGGGEYVNKDLIKFFKDKGIIHELTPPYSHESNGIAEHFNRTIVTMEEQCWMLYP